VEEATTGAAHAVLVNSRFTAGVFSATFRRLAAAGVVPRVLYPAVAVPPDSSLAAASSGWARQLLLASPPTAPASAAAARRGADAGRQEESGASAVGVAAGAAAAAPEGGSCQTAFGTREPMHELVSWLQAGGPLLLSINRRVPREHWPVRGRAPS
jgi:hypothetical protein